MFTKVHYMFVAIFASCTIMLSTAYEVTLYHKGTPLEFTYQDGRDFLFNHEQKHKELVAKALSVPEEYVFIDEDEITISDIHDVVSEKLSSRWTGSHSYTLEHVFTSKTRPTIKFSVKRNRHTRQLNIAKKEDMKEFLRTFLLQESMFKLSLSDANFYCKLARNLTLLDFSEVLDALEEISDESDLAHHVTTLKKLGLRQIEKRKYSSRFSARRAMLAPVDFGMGGRTI